jgi:hypothetical protein
MHQFTPNASGMALFLESEAHSRGEIQFFDRSKGVAGVFRRIRCAGALLDYIYIIYSYIELERERDPPQMGAVF